MGKMESLVSVIVPVYRVEAYLEQCLESIVHQTYPNLEIILVDDGSDDGSGAICDLYRERDSRVFVIHKDNEGADMARNIGLDAAHGKWVMFVDSDDWIDPDMVETLLAEGERHGADLVKSAFLPAETKAGYQLYSDREQILRKVLCPTLGEDVKGAPDAGRITMSLCMRLYSLSLIRENHLYILKQKEILSEDILFNLEYILRCGCVVCIPKKMYHYRKNLQSLSHRYDPAKRIQLRNFFQHIERFVDENGLKEYAGHRTERFYMMMTRSILMGAASSNLSLKERIEEYRQAVNEPVTERIAAGYPMKQVPLRERVMVSLMRKKSVYRLFGYLRLQCWAVAVRDCLYEWTGRRK